ncbi:hypothetical protein ACFXG4_41480 [Nocardia sp. NPDC059246]|uniref:hypothetical protein n=1 Tax=unclassified Nocardia TaxID=2637762 RepID=UPI0036BB12FA
MLGNVAAMAAVWMLAWPGVVRAWQHTSPGKPSTATDPTSNGQDTPKTTTGRWRT